MSQKGIDLDGLKPIPESDRPMGPVSYMLVMWSSVIIVQIMVIGTFLIQDGLNLYQVMAVCIVSGVLISLFATLNGTPGIKYGIPFAIQVRSSFGYRGAVFPHVIRAVPAIAWYGIGSWIGALAIDSIMRTIFDAPSLVALYFIVFIALQTLLAYKGITTIKWFDASVSFIIIIMLIYFIIHVLNEGSLDFAQHTGHAGSWGLLFWGGVAAAVANLATIIVNSSDIIRHIKPATGGANTFANFVGIIPPWIFMFLIGAFVFMGTGVDDPIDGLIALSPNPAFGIFLLIFIILAQVTSNLSFNILPPALIMREMFNFKFGTGVIITGILACISAPWVLFTSDWFFTFQNVYSSFLGPILGVMLADFWIFRKRRLNLTHLYEEDSKAFRYYKGISPAAYVAMFVGAALAFWLLEIAWLVGFPSAFIVYCILKWAGMERKYEEQERSASTPEGSDSSATMNVD